MDDDKKMVDLWAVIWKLCGLENHGKSTSDLVEVEHARHDRADVRVCSDHAILSDIGSTCEP